MMIFPFLQNIVKDNVSESHEIDDIRKALSVMTNIASHINEMKRKHEHAVRVQEIQSLLLGWMVRLSVKIIYYQDLRNLLSNCACLSAMQLLSRYWRALFEELNL